MTHPPVVAKRSVLTYMSIRVEWQRLTAPGGDLYSLPPLDGDRHTRTIVCGPDMREVIDADWEGEDGIRKAKLLATLQGIVAGRRLVVCLEPFQARLAVMGRIDPVKDSVFDIRCQDSPAIRVFCQFLEKDVLFATTCRPRSVKTSWISWLPLGNRDSKEWKRAITFTKREWARFFPTFSPVSGENLHDYLSNAAPERNRRSAGRHHPGSQARLFS